MEELDFWRARLEDPRKLEAYRLLGMAALELEDAQRWQCAHPQRVCELGNTRGAAGDVVHSDVLQLLRRCFVRAERLGQRHEADVANVTVAQVDGFKIWHVAVVKDLGEAKRTLLANLVPPEAQLAQLDA